MPPRWDPSTGENVRWVAELGSYSYGGPVVAGRQGLRRHQQRAASRPCGHRRSRRVDGVSRRGRLVPLAVDASQARAGASTFRCRECARRRRSKAIASTTSPIAASCWRSTSRASSTARTTARSPTRRRTDAPTPTWSGASTCGASSASCRTSCRRRRRRSSATSSSSSPRTASTRAGAVPAPRAPSFIAVDRRDGTVRWSDASPGADLVDGQWSSPTVIDGRREEAGPLPGRRRLALLVRARETGSSLEVGRWRRRPGRSRGDQRNAFVATAVEEQRSRLPRGRPRPGAGLGTGQPVVPRSSGAGDDPAARGRAGRFGGTTATAPATSTTPPGGDGRARAGVLLAIDRHRRRRRTASSTPPTSTAIVVALDAGSGRELWRHDMLAPVWASPLVADGPRLRFGHRRRGGGPRGRRRAAACSPRSRWKRRSTGRRRWRAASST